RRDQPSVDSLVSEVQTVARNPATPLRTAADRTYERVRLTYLVQRGHRSAIPFLFGPDVHVIHPRQNLTSSHLDHPEPDGVRLGIERRALDRSGREHGDTRFAAEHLVEAWRFGPVDSASSRWLCQATQPAESEQRRRDTTAKQRRSGSSA